MPPPLHPLPRGTSPVYVASRQLLRGIGRITVRANVLHERHVRQQGPFILSPTHISHLEPFLLSMLIDRHIDWMSRIEFYGRWWSSRFLNHVGAFPVRRFGVPVSAIRTAIHRVELGRCVGVFPEGGVAVGAESLCRGAPMKRGVCLIAYRTGVPVVPCVVLGTHRLNQVGPWIPWGRAKLYIAFGEPVFADRAHPSKASREAMAKTLEKAYQSLFRELIDTFQVDEADIP